MAVLSWLHSTAVINGCVLGSNKHKRAQFAWVEPIFSKRESEKVSDGQTRPVQPLVVCTEKQCVKELAMPRRW